MTKQKAEVISLKKVLREREKEMEVRRQHELNRKERERAMPFVEPMTMEQMDKANRRTLDHMRLACYILADGLTEVSKTQMLNEFLRIFIEYADDEAIKVAYNWIVNAQKPHNERADAMRAFIMKRQEKRIT